MDRKNGTIWGIALGLGALAAYFLFRNKATAAIAPTSGANDYTAALPNVSITSVGLPSGLAEATGALNQPIYETVTSAPTTSGMSATNAFWAGLPNTVSSPSSGWVITPEGSQVPASLIPWRQDSSGNTYVLWGVDVYQITGQDGNGNYTTSPVAGTSSAFEMSGS